MTTGKMNRMNMASLLDRSILSQFRDGEARLIERLDRIIELLEAMQTNSSGDPSLRVVADADGGV